MTRCPRPYLPDAGRDALEAVPWARGAVAELLNGTGGSSPYLKGLIAREAEWLQSALDDPEGTLSVLMTKVGALRADTVAPGLRQAKRRVALLTALADLAGVWPLEKVTGTLSDFADLACEAALRPALALEVKRGKLPGMTEADLETACGMVVLAMGKMGGAELNYSSDIDLICLFDETRFDPEQYHEARSGFVRATRKMSGTLNDLTGDGYVFRTDLRLRPDPSVTPVCMAMDAAERYYESLGRTWERAAYIKARPAAGDIAAGQTFLETLRPFIWRRHLDFAAIQDAHDIRLRIRKHKGLGGPITVPGHNLKLGRGGIREIEFFTQTRQLIAGGRDPDLRVRGTVPGLRVLASKGWFPPEVAETLARHYRHLREVEHRVQMINDAQTHDMPGSDDGLDRLASLMGLDTTTMTRDLRDRLTEVHQLTEGFFAPDACEPAAESDNENAITSRWPNYPALRSGRAVEIFNRLRPEILSRLGQAAKPDEALLAFDGFLEGLPAGVQVFSLFEANPQLIDLLVDITGISADLARHLSRNAGVLDAVIGGDFFADWPGGVALTAELGDVLAREADYERKLDAARRWGKEWHFRIGVHLLRGLADAAETGMRYADLAQASLAGLWPVVQAEFAKKHGPAPGRGAVVLGMGSLGAGRLHARSDLDVIVIYDPDGVETSDGRRPLPSRTYYARLTQALITGLTAPMAEGRLYELDMRLRPSGNQGPVATSLDAFRTYQKNDAWTWEHLALTRARVVAGPVALAQDVEAFRNTLLIVPRDDHEVLRDVAQMRARIAAAKRASDPWDPKLGRGRMQDIELFAQAGALVSATPDRSVATGIEAARDLGWISAPQAAHLVHTHTLCWTVQIGARLISDSVLKPQALGAGGCRFLTKLAGVTGIDALLSQLEQDAAAAAAILDAVLPDAEETS
ncbi:glutamine synthetase adenylyltransferase [Puniceibacterium sp. IMCC21224]|nr:glutamine synthetase adenylyltransferase [Puniceibacterium sp. IMCC21224]